MPGINANEWMNSVDYAREISSMYSLGKKFNVMVVLKDGLDILSYFSHYLQEFGEIEDEKKQTLRTSLCLQILAQSVELTEDLAGVCCSYATAIRCNHPLLFPMWLRNFGRTRELLKLPFPNIKELVKLFGRVNIFYEKSKEQSYVAEIAGLDPSSDDTRISQVEEILSEVKKYRLDNNDWYQGYKHAQRVFPVRVPISTSNGQTGYWYCAYMIPESLSEKDGKVFVKPLLLKPIDKVNQYGELGKKVVELWKEIRERQHNRLFGMSP